MTASTGWEEAEAAPSWNCPVLLPTATSVSTGCTNHLRPSGPDSGLKGAVIWEQQKHGPSPWGFANGAYYRAPPPLALTSFSKSRTSSKEKPKRGVFGLVWQASYSRGKEGQRAESPEDCKCQARRSLGAGRYATTHQTVTASHGHSLSTSSLVPFLHGDGPVGEEGTCSMVLKSQSLKC